MLVLNCSSKLAALRKLLSHSFPESIKACGALQHVITGNEFKLEVLIDQWPDFSTVLCRPSLEDMKDPSDNFMNTYFLFSKNPQNLSRMLEDPQVVNWNQDFEIHGCQPSLEGVLQKVSSKYGSQMQTFGGLLCSREKITDEELEKINSLSSNEFSYTPLLVHEAPLVNNHMIFGKNQHSLRYIERCIQYLPSVCVRKKGLDQPISWVLTDCSMEQRMIYTAPAYRKLGLSCNILLKILEIIRERGDLNYGCLLTDNIPSHGMVLKAGYQFTGKWVQFCFTQNK